MATILKPHAQHVLQQDSSPRGLAGFNLDDITQQTHRKLEEFRAEVATMMQQANAEAEQVRQQAKAQGLEEGRAQAAQEADQRLQAELQKRVGDQASTVRMMVQQIAEQHNQWMHQYSQTLVQLVVDVAERIVRRKLEHEPQILLRWTEDALSSARSAQRLTVAVHPETLAELGQDLETLLRTPGFPEDSTLIPDESVERWGVVVRQLGGQIDAGLTTQLNALKDLLNETV